MGAECVRVKICCISSLWEAAQAVRAGVAALGLVSAMPSGPGVIDDEKIADIARAVPPGVSRFLLTSLTDADAIVRQVRRAGVDTIQLVDRVLPVVYDRLRADLPGVRLVQVVHVLGAESVGEAMTAAGADAILPDSGNPDLVVKELGGTGRKHDRTISRRIRDVLDKPLFLAGGLTPDNAADAVRAVRPFGVDVCSGVRTEGRLGPDRLARFIDAAQSA